MASGGRREGRARQSAWWQRAGKDSEVITHRKLGKVGRRWAKA